MTKVIFRVAVPLLVVLGILGCSVRDAALEPESPVSNLTPLPTSADPYAPRPEDANLQRGNAFVEEAGVAVMESFPVQIMLHVSGNLPDPCHELRIAVSEPDDQNNIAIDVYSVVDPSLICIQVIKPFSASMNLGSYPSGHYTVTVNGEAAGEFDA
jgi:hypothetical protein